MRRCVDGEGSVAEVEGQLAEVAQQVNNGYLVVNGQEDGVKSYGRVVDLILAYYRSETE